MTRPAMRGHALRFHEDRETEIHARFAAMARRMLSDAATAHTHRFRIDRWDESQDGGYHTSGGVSPQQGQTERLSRQESQAEGVSPDSDDEAQIRAAFERLRSAPRFRVRRGSGVIVEPRAAVSGSEIVLEQRIVSGPSAAGVRFVRDVDVIGLIALAPGYSEVPDLFDAYCRNTGPVALPDFLRALATALARGWLVAE
jgi:hypothetical protein